MKRFRFIIVIGLILVANFVSGQDSTDTSVPTKIPIGERKLTFYAAGIYNAYEYGGWNLGLNIQNIPTEMRIFQRVYLGLEITRHAQLGLEAGVRPLKKSWGKVNYANKIGLVFHDRNNVFTPHDSLVSGSIGAPGKMIIAFQLGCSLEIINRFGIFATFNPGISFRPDSKFNWGHNGYWYWGYEGGFYFNFGGMKKIKDVTMNNNYINQSYSWS